MCKLGPHVYVHFHYFFYRLYLCLSNWLLKWKAMTCFLYFISGVFNLNVSVDSLFFIGSQLVALSKLGKVGVWHSMTHNWQVYTLNTLPPAGLHSKYSVTCNSKTSGDKLCCEHKCYFKSHCLKEVNSLNNFQDVKFLQWSMSL